MFSSSPQVSLLLKNDPLKVCEWPLIWYPPALSVFLLIFIEGQAVVHTGIRPHLWRHRRSC